MRKIVGALAVGALSLAMGAFTVNAGTTGKTPHGFYEGKADWKKHHNAKPPGWNKGEKTGWDNYNKPPGLRR